MRHDRTAHTHTVRNALVQGHLINFVDQVHQAANVAVMFAVHVISCLPAPHEVVPSLQLYERPHHVWPWPPLALPFSLLVTTHWESVVALFHTLLSHS